jgi:hypothetical protein
LPALQFAEIGPQIPQMFYSPIEIWSQSSKKNSICQLLKPLRGNNIDKIMETVCAQVGLEENGASILLAWSLRVN